VLHVTHDPRDLAAVADLVAVLDGLTGEL